MRIASVVRWLCGLGVGAACMTVLLFLSAYASVVHGFLGNGESSADCVLVFGAAVVGNRLPGPAIIRRVDRASNLYLDGDVGTIVFSGGKGIGNARSEAEVMREQAIARGVKANDIVLESESRSTWENIAYSAPIVRPRCTSVVAVSDRYHLERIRMIAKRQGWGTLATVPATDDLNFPRAGESVLREVFGVLYYGMFADIFLNNERVRTWLPKEFGRQYTSILKKPQNG